MDSTPSESAAAPKPNKFQDQVNSLLNLLTGDAEVNEHEIENALASIVPNVDAKKKEAPATAPSPVTDVAVGERNDDMMCDLEEDEDDYDDIDDNNKSSSPNQAKSANKKQCVPKSKTEAAGQDNKDDEDGLKDATADVIIPSTFENLLDIPMGNVGGKMMVTFGDGKYPDPDATAAALQVTRLCLQSAIKSARAHNRKSIENMEKAEEYGGMRMKSKSAKEQYDISANDVDASAMFSVFTKVRGAGSHKKKCGFRLEELRALFPEQMNEYDRWCKMRQASDKKAADEGDDEDDVKELDDDDTWEGGYMRLRRAKFDHRTDVMKNKTYLSYAEARRQGSFLPPKRTIEDRQWNAANKKSRGKPKDGTWEGKSSCSVQFLYWVGFDPRSALPPPDEAITQALAYIGYDMMGRIIEKAIECKRKGSKDANSTNFQLGPGAQLSVRDVEAAKNDPEILSLLDGNVKKGEGVKASQLYFGPGFEQRLELELEQITGEEKSEKKKSGENDTEKAEDELFESLVKPRILEGVTDVLCEENGEELLKQRSRTKKFQKRFQATRARKQKLLDGLDVSAELPKKKRGRPKKTNIEDRPKKKRGRLKKNSSSSSNEKSASKDKNDNNPQEISDSSPPHIDVEGVETHECTRRQSNRRTSRGKRICYEEM